MTLLFSSLLSSIIQLGLFILIPFIWWWIWYRKNKFWGWIGIKKVIPVKLSLSLVSLVALMLFCSTGYFVFQTLPSSSVLASTKFTNFNFPTVISIILYAFFQTGLAEEILFRGFLAKRLISRLGFVIGNIIQSLLFGALHVVFFAPIATISVVIIVFIFTSVIGFLLCYIDERLANGSIIPSWLIHGFSNVFSTTLVILNLI
ncbi:CPBP family intramembrane metalloprotease [Lentilactobacillus diolivorans]|uniref:CPBP family intramembrane glutamic endopeptidase n=1 Tax=Lentilactobacillus diolivorans TaxID=179838 RepID=UPI002468B7AF|nr:CPBP family intramembrane metalloprotease [Lentilactobacillus diolivorans]MDH5104630.1 CPBP family intramembrane metalloprotease [Lentilactobacillus diolivorans]